MPIDNSAQQGSERPMSTSISPQPDASALAEHSELVRAELGRQQALWERASTRRTFLSGLGIVGVAALGAQLVTARVAYAAGAPKEVNTLVHIALHGGVDGLRLLVPGSTHLGIDDLRRARPTLVPSNSDLIALPGAAGWAVNAELLPLLPLWRTGELAFVPAVMSPGATRSHFESYRNLQAGSTSPEPSGWLDRVLEHVGPGTTFRAMGFGETTSPASYLGAESALVLESLADFVVPAARGRRASTLSAIHGLYRGVSGDLSTTVTDTVSALRTAGSLRAAASAPRNGAKYPSGAFSRALADVATTVRGEVGLQVCTIDVGGWDTHSAEAAGLDRQLGALSTALAAFMQDLGTRRSRVTVLVQTEFGRRVAQNGNAGTDHGLGSVAIVLGGGLRRSGVYGKWAGLAPSVLDHGDVPGLNHPFDLMGELVQQRLGAKSMGAIFPGHRYTPLGIVRR